MTPVDLRYHSFRAGGVLCIMTRLSTASCSDTSYGRICEAVEVFYHLEIVLHGPYHEVVVAPARDHLVIRTESDRTDSPKMG